jgi:hypothetical protein
VVVTGQMVVETSTKTVVWSTTISVVPGGGGAGVLTTGTMVEVTMVSVLTMVLPAGQETTSGPQEVIVLVLVSVTTSVVNDVTGG